MFAITCGLENADDCENLRTDHLFKVVVVRASEGSRIEPHSRWAHGGRFRRSECARSRRLVRARHDGPALGQPVLGERFPDGFG